MTDEAIPNGGDYLVEVQAQVMIRDDSTGGWVPMEGGGVSRVGLKHLRVNSGGGGEPRNDYYIIGKRLTDSVTVLNCSLKSDIEYFKVNPKFLHWKTDDKKFGLTFESSYDARAFDKSMNKAVTELTFSYLNGCPSSNIDEDSVFQMIDLPRGRTGSSSQSASTTSTTTSSPAPRSPTSVIPGLSESFSYQSQTNHLHRIHYISQPPHSRRVNSSFHSVKSGSHKSDSFESSSGLDDPWVRGDDPTSLSGKSDQGLLDLELSKEDAYVYFAKNKPGAPHEYSYPSLEPTQKPPTKRESSSKRQCLSQPHPPVALPINKMNKNATQNLLGQQSVCKHCNEMFSLDENVRGSCEDAPDRVTKCIECVTCVICAHSLNYHCLSDADGEYHHPCQCDGNDSSNCKKWTAMTILSFFLPCLWCYFPLTACHRCGVSCGHCGARHKAM
ncbi:hypothetical protein LOTGIDRAFT_235185 [Lottia gigantea]|uniref:WH1 domain-containing protein n=1 Tax=Lottia gigantea TaxID=225164 RepID=V4BDK4_LOTGI|nr:hypothetical protein LOTGIDRAFT_235185 [Lottia gigantea]ESO86754.1 hypothetical protein LOTGIDRAFT_235185 [Lottia gigantea]